MLIVIKKSPIPVMWLHLNNRKRYFSVQGDTVYYSKRAGSGLKVQYLVIPEHTYTLTERVIHVSNGDELCGEPDDVNHMYSLLSEYERMIDENSLIDNIDTLISQINHQV
jgi:hypothetical protein